MIVKPERKILAWFVCVCVKLLLEGGENLFDDFRECFWKASICWDKTVMAVLTSNVMDSNEPW